MIINCKSIRDNNISKLKETKFDKDKYVAFIQTGNFAPSDVYVKNKIKLCDEIGINYTHLKHEKISEEELLEIIKDLNEDANCFGIMVQLPLIEGIDENKVINSINPIKDIDGFHIENKGKVVIGDQSGIIAATPLGIMTMLKELNIPLKGKNVTIVGRSNIVGKPLTSLMINESATVLSCNSSTNKEILRTAIATSDIFISAIGQANYFSRDFITDGEDRTMPYLGDTIAIDVGINRDENGNLCGDIDKGLYDEFKMVTSVPGGVGVMTTLSVLLNIVKLYELNLKDGR